MSFVYAILRIQPRLAGEMVEDTIILGVFTDHASAMDEALSEWRRLHEFEPGSEILIDKYKENNEAYIFEDREEWIQYINPEFDVNNIANEKEIYDNTFDNKIFIQKVPLNKIIKL